MAQMLYSENPRRGKKRGRKRNPTATQIKPAKNPVAIKRRNISLSTIKSAAKKNGLKLVSKSAANPKRKRRTRRRNGLATTAISRRSNGILGNSKQDVKQTSALLLGMALTKGLGRIAQSFANPFLAQMGIGKYSEILCDVAIALFVVPFGFSKVAGAEAGKFGRLGGLGVVGLDVLNVVAPNVVSQYNPFNMSPIMLNASGQPVMPVQDAVNLAAEVANSPNPKATAAQLQGAMYDTGFAGANTPYYGGETNDYLVAGGVN